MRSTRHSRLTLPAALTLLLGTGVALLPPAAAGMSRQPAQQSHVQHIYATGGGVDGVVGINVRPGTAPQLAGPPTPGGTGAVAVAPDGRHLYVATAASIAAFAIRSDGRPTQLTGSPVAAPASIVTLAVAPNGKHLYAAASGASATEPGTVITYAIGSDGLPAQAAPPVPLDATANFGMIAITPDGHNLYVADYFGRQMIQLPIQADGVAGAPRHRAGTDGNPANPAVSPDGKYLFVPNEEGATVAVFSIGSDGSMTMVPGAPFFAGVTPHAVAFSPDSSRAYVTDEMGNSIYGYSVGSDGALTQLAGSPYAGSQSPSKALSSADGARLYLVELGWPAALGTSRLLTYDVLPNGALQQSEPPLQTGLYTSDGMNSVITP